MKIPSFISVLRVCIAVVILLLMPIGQALAADITVDADCSLQNAILSANEEEMVEPRSDCEAGAVDDGNSQVDDGGNVIPAGLDTITIDVSGADEGVIALDGKLTVTSNIAIEGGGLAIEGGGNQIFNVTAGSLTASNLNIRGGWSDDNGGAIAVSNAAVTLINSVVSDSGAKKLGGGIYAVDSDLTLVDSAVTGSATGVLTKPETPEADDSGTETTTAPAEEPITWDTFGGGIYFEGAANRLVVNRSGLSANAAHSKGGGVYIASGSASIRNSTISDNRAGTDGGGLYNGGASTLTHVTIVDNFAENIGGLVDASELQLYNSILSGNAGGDCSGTLNALLGSLIRDGSCGHDGLSEDPKLLLLDGIPPYYVPQNGSAALDAASPDHCLLTDQRGIDRAPDTCDIGAAEFADGAFQFQIQSALALLNLPGPGGEADGDEQESEPKATPNPSLCASLPGHYRVEDYTYSSHCKLADHAGIGNQMLVNNGAIDAVDIFGWVAQPLKMCFLRPSGAIVLLDAATSPRTLMALRTWTEDGWLCATVDRNGTAVLMPIEFFSSGLIPEPIWDLTGCTVTTANILNLRSEPNNASAIIANVLNDVTLTADKRATHYYRVNYYDIVGWLSSSYLSMSGTCM
ncbi:MAG: hypothetical protein OXG84_16525 [Chloroflexi bacterium]|nr:hypothetical protein [Chloroflexota bacterium]